MAKKMTRSEFILYITKLVTDYRKTAKTPPDFFDSVTIAQACLETGFGTSALYLGFNNAFGYKAKVVKGVPEWLGKIAGDYKSHEEIDGVLVKDVPSDFRAYDKVEESVRDHANMMTSRGADYKAIYAKAINAKTPEEQAHALTHKYAGDSLYGEKLMAIIMDLNLEQHDKKESDTVAKLTLEQAFAKLGLKFSKQLLPLNKTFGRVNRKEGIAIHQTGAPQANKTAQWMADYQKSMSSPSNPEEKSWNYQVDDKEAIMSFEHNVATWQASDGNGPGNMAHISIESCINAGANYAKGIDNLAKTMAVIAYVENFNIEKHTKRHYDFARDKKWCPAQIMNGQGGFTYAKLKAMAQAHLDILNGAATPQKPKNTANPQGLETSKIPSYKAPTLEFKRLKKGDKVKFRAPWNWYDDSKKEFIHSKKHDELAGTHFTIEQVKEIDPIGYSKIAYKSKEHNSWILEQDIIEAREDWKVEEVESDLKDEGKDLQELKEGQFWIEDTLYQVEKIK